MRRPLQNNSDPQASPTTRRWHVLVLAAILLVGASLRIAYLLELRKSPEFTYHSVDAAFHDYWARGLATGDWTVPDGYADPQIRTTAYLRPPGYPFFLAAVYYVCGTGPWAPRIVQMALGLVNCVLVYLLGRKWIGSTVGLVAAALMAVYWVFIYFEGKLHAPTLLISLTLCMMYALATWVSRLTWLRALVTGVLLGLVAVVRPTILPFGAVVILWALWVIGRESGLRHVVACVAFFALGVVLAVSPVAIRNYLVARDFVLISSNAGINLYIGNNERANGLFVSTIEPFGDFGTCFEYRGLVRAIQRKTGTSLSDSEVSAYFAARAWDYVAAHPMRTIKLGLKKFLLWWGPNEISHNEIPDFDRRHSGVLHWLVGNFTMVVSLGLLGVLVFFLDVRNQRRAHRTLTVPVRNRRTLALGFLAFVVVYSASFLPFFVTSLYRVPIIPLLLLFAAYGVCRCVELVRAGNWRWAGALAALGGILYVVAGRNYSDYQPDPARPHYHLGVVYERAGQLEQAEQEYGAALRIEPDYYLAHYNLGVLLGERGELGQAIAHYQAALRSRPNHAGARNNLALTLAAEGDIDEAIRHCRLAVESRPDDADLHNNLAALLSKAGRTPEAVEQYQTAVRLNPDDAEIRRNLAAALESVGRDEQALLQYTEAVRIAPHDADAHIRLGLALARRGRLAEAIDHYRRVIEARPDHALAHYNLGNALAQQGRDRDALDHFRQAVQLRPEYHVMLDSLAWLLATSRDDQVRNGLESVRLAERACQLVGRDDPKLLDTLAAAYAAAGRFDDAVTTADRAIQAALSRGDAHYATEIRSRLKRYRSGKSLPQYPPTNPAQ